MKKDHFILISTIALLTIIIFSPFIIPDEVINSLSLQGYESFHWNQGNSNSKDAKLSIYVFIEQINIENDQSIKIGTNFLKYINNSFYQSSQEKIVTFHDYEFQNINSQLLNYNGQEIYHLNGKLENYPIDKYNLNISINNLDSINITQANQIYLNIFKISSAWNFRFSSIKVKLSNFNYLLNKNTTNLEISLSFYRNYLDSMRVLIIPLATFFVIGIFGLIIPYNEFKDSSEYLGKVEIKRKVKYDLAKWVFLFDLGYLFLNQFSSSHFTIGLIFSILAIISSFTYFIFSTQEKEKNVKIINFIEKFSILILLIFIILLLLINIYLSLF